ncbi:MAG: hypothetical protein IPN53_01605 [Comamonadaceae bacterium]|nr:hypothetical protein [Comamonadaceae bacterium]
MFWQKSNWFDWRTWVMCCVLMLATPVWSADLLTETWESGSINSSVWTSYGSPAPGVVAAIGGRSGFIFDNNGDLSYDSGVFSVQPLSLSAGSSIEADIYLDFSNLAGCWAQVSFALSDSTAPVASVNPNWGGFYWSIGAHGDACASPANLNRKSWFSFGVMPAGGTWESSNDAINADSYARGWHKARVDFQADGRVTFSIDGIALWTSTQPMDSKFLTGRRLILGSRSSGSAGKAYHDNIKVNVAASSVVDDFSGSLSNWVNQGGNWATSNGKLTVDYNISCGSAGCPQADLVLSDQLQPIGDFEASVDFSKTSDPRGYGWTYAQFSLWVNSNQKIEIGIGAASQGVWGGPQTTINVDVQQWNGAWTSAKPAASFPYIWNADQTQTATIKKVGNIYSIYINGTYLTNFTDNFLNGAGKIGLHSYGPKIYDNFRLNSIGTLDNGLVAYYPFDGNANDASGNGRAGTPIGNPTYSAGVKNSAIDISLGNFVSVTNRFVPGSGSFSFSAFAKESSAVAYHMAPIITLQGGDFANGAMLLAGSSTATPSLVMSIVAGTNSGQNVNYSPAKRGGWHHVAAIVDRESGKVTLYEDGVNVKQETISFSGAISPSMDMLIGTYDYITARNGLPRFYSGSISLDEVRIYNRALTPTEIQQLYTLSAPPPQYTLTVSQSGSAQGVAITANPYNASGSTPYTKPGVSAGSVIMLTAPTTVGSSTFERWEGCDLPFLNQCKVTMNASRSVTAVYSATLKPNLALSNLSVSVSGAVAAVSVQVKNTGNAAVSASTVRFYLSDNSVLDTTRDTDTQVVCNVPSLVAILGIHTCNVNLALSNSKRWFVGASVSPTNTSVVETDYGDNNVVSSKSVIAVSASRTLLVHVIGAGRVTSSSLLAGTNINCDSTGDGNSVCQTFIDAGSSVKLTATRANGAQFISWSGGGCNTTLSCTVSILSSPLVTEVTARFTQPQKPAVRVLFIPGFLGTRLNDVSNPNDPKVLWPSTDNNDIRAFQLTSDLSNAHKISTGLPTDSDRGLVLDVLAAYVYTKPAYRGLVQFLDDYVGPTHWASVPWDWRQDLWTQIDRIKAAVDATPKDAPLIIMAHSLGGLLTRAYLKANKSAGISRFISVAVPHYGAPEAFKELLHGEIDLAANGVEGLYPGPIPAGLWRQTGVNMPSSYQLLPTKGAFGSQKPFDGIGPVRLGSSSTGCPVPVAPINNGYGGFTVWLSDTNGKTDKPLDPTQTPLVLQKSLTTLAEESHADGYLFDWTPDIPTVLIAGKTENLKSTVESVSYYYQETWSATDASGNTVRNCSLRHSYNRTAGDETVPFWSASKLPNSNGNVDLKTIDLGSNYSHSTIFDASETQRFLNELFTSATGGQSGPVAQQNQLMAVPPPQQAFESISKAPAPQQQFQLTVSGGSLALHAYDASGQHIGPMVDGSLQTQIPGGQYYANEYVHQMSLLGATEDYRLELHATGASLVNWELETTLDAAVVGKLSFSGIDLAAGDVLKQGLVDGALQLMLDRGGDGVVDAVIAPDAAQSLALKTVGGGVIQSNVPGVTCSGECVELRQLGDNIELTAVPSAGYSFQGWTGACSGSNTTCAPPSTQAAEVVATFSAVSFNLSTVASPPERGTVVCSPNPVLTGGSASCVASANPGFNFGEWTGVCAGTVGNTCTLTNVTPSTSATAAFVAIPGAPVVSLSPTSISFSEQIVGTTSAAKNATLTNTGNAPSQFQRSARRVTLPSVTTVAPAWLPVLRAILASHSRRQPPQDAWAQPRSPVMRQAAHTA